MANLGGGSPSGGSLVVAGSGGNLSGGRAAPGAVPGAVAAPGLEVALGTRLNRAQRDAYARAIAEGTRIGSAPGGGLLGALSRDISGLITSIPQQAVYGGRVLSTIGSLSFVPVAEGLRAVGVDQPSNALRGYQRGTVDQTIEMGRAIIEDYRYRYGDIANVSGLDLLLGRGDARARFGRTADKFQAHPLSYLLDAGSVYSGLGKGASLGARAAGFGPEGRFAVPAGTGSRAQRFLSYIGDTSAAGRRRLREDRQVYVPDAASTEDLLPVSVPRRAGSLNPVTNAVQRFVDRRVDARDAAAAGAAGRLPQTIGGFTVPGSVTSRYNAATRRLGQTIRMQSSDDARREFTVTSREYQKLIRRIGPVSKKLRGRDGYEEALTEHLRGNLDYKALGYETPQEALAATIDYYRQGVAEARAAGENVAESEKALARVEKLAEHPELLDLETAPPLLRQTVAEARKLIRTGQGKITSSEDFVRPGTGLITKKMVEESRQRAARQIHGGSTYEPTLARPDAVVETQSLGPQSVRSLTEARDALNRRIREIKKPAARKEALKEVRDIERQINDGIRAFQRGNREEGALLIRQGTERLRALEENRQASLPGGLSALGPAVIPELRQIAGQDRIIARASELEAEAAALEARYQGLLDHVSSRSGDRGARNEFLSAADEEARALEDFATQNGAAGLSFAEVFQSDNLYPLITEHVRPSEPVRWKPGKMPAAASKETRALVEEYDALSDLRSRIVERGKAGKGGELEGYDRASIEPALKEAAQKVRDQLRKEADARNAARGADLPSRLAAIRKRVSRARAETLPKIASEIARINGQRPLDIYRLVQAARAELEKLGPATAKERGPLEKWIGVLEDAFRESIAERVALIPDGPEREQALRIIADPQSAPLALPDGPLPLRHPQEVLAAIEEVRALRAEAAVMRQAIDHHEGRSALELAEPEVAQSLADVYDALSESLGTVERSSFSSRRRRAANASEATGPKPGLVSKEQRARGRRQAGRMFGEGSKVPRSRESFGTDVPGLVGKKMSDRVERPPTPVEAAVESIALGQRQGLIALEHLIPEEMAKQHRAALAQVYEELGAVRASFGGTPSDLAAAIADVKVVARELRRAREMTTGGWTTPRHIDAMHAQIPHTAEMTEANAALQKARQSLEDIEVEIRDLEESRSTHPDDVARVNLLLGQRKRAEARIRRAEVAFHELETQEGIKLYGAMQDVEGDYLPAKPRKGQKTKPTSDDRGGRPRPQNRFTAERIYHNTGKLLRHFNTETGRRDPLYVLMRGLRAEHSSRALEALMETAGVRWARAGRDERGILTHKAGDLVTGPKAITMMRQSPDAFRVVHIPSMHNVLEKLRDEAGDGDWYDQSIMERIFAKAEDAQSVEDALVRGEWNPNDVVLLPKAAADEYVDASHGIFRSYDNALGVWKAGVLAFTPRWYVLNLIGNTLQYGLMSGGDARSILLAGLGRYVHPTKKGRARYAALSEDFSHAVPEELASVSQAAEASQALATDRNFTRVADRAFEFNQKLEGLIRRAAYINAAKREVKYAGKRGQTRSAADLVQAIDELPAVAKEAALREALFFLGDYRRFNRFERGFVRRVMPFYSWVRVISRLTLGLPFRSPLRAQALQLLSTALADQWDPLEKALEEGRPLFARGGIEIPDAVPVVGGLTLSTNALNPFQTAAELYTGPLYALGQGGPSAALGEAIQSIAPSLAPGTTAIVEAATPGFNVFGNRAVSAPPGFGGLVSSFGASAMVPGATGYQKTSGASTPFIENLLQSFLPYYGSTARQLAQGSRTAYDTASLPAIIANRLGIKVDVPGFHSRDYQTFRPPNQNPAASAPVPYLTPLSSFLGFRVSQRNEGAEAEQRIKELERAQTALEQTRQKIAESIAALQGSP